MIYGFCIAKNVISQEYPIDLVMKQAQGLIDHLIIGVARENNDNTKELIEKTRHEVNYITEVVELDWGPPDVCWYEESLDKTLQSKLFEYIPYGEWTFKLDIDECYHEKDYAELRELLEQWKDSNIAVVATNYRAFIGSLGTAYADPCKYAPRIFKMGLAEWAGNDAMSLRPKSSSFLSIYLDDIYLYHFNYVKSPELLTTKLREHVTLNKSVLPSYNVEQMKWKWPKHIPGRNKMEIWFKEVEYQPFPEEDLPREFRNNQERFNFYNPFGIQ